MISFQLFVLECCKVQETLKKMYEDNSDSHGVKLEKLPVDYGVQIKSEVR